MIYFFICLFFSLLIFVSVIFLVKNIFDHLNTFKIVTSFESYITVLNYHMSKAYDIIYKDRILIYSVESTKINENEFSVVTKDYTYLVLKLLGPKLKKEFIKLYGNEETLIFNIVEYFNNKYENDEIRKSAMESTMEDEEIKT